jgi:hypothetical protein
LSLTKNTYRPEKHFSQATSYLFSFTKTGSEHCRSRLPTPGSTMDTFGWGESHNILIFLLNGQIKAKGLNFLSDSWSVPFALSCICLFLHIIHILLHWINILLKPGSVVETEPSLTDTMASTFSHSLKKRVKSHGGWTIYLFMVARLFGCLVLFALSVDSLLRCQKNHPDVDTVFKHLFVCPEGSLTFTFVNPFLRSLS